MKKLYLILLLLSTISLNLYPEDGLSRSAWEKVSKQKNYTENFKEAEKKEKKEKKTRELHPRPRTQQNAKITRIISLILIGIVLTTLLVMLLYNMSPTRTLSKASRNIPIEELDDPNQIRKSELENLLTQAIQARNFRLAVRIHFLYLIKELKEKEHIKWERKKTNYDYLREVRERTYAPKFKALVITFEKVWYADYPIDEKTYGIVEYNFKDLSENISD